MEIRDKIKQKRDAIWKSVGMNGHSDGTAIGTEEEMWWLAMEAAPTDAIRGKENGN